MSGVVLAQTNLQLLRQLADLGWEPAQLERVVAAYDLAAELFAGRHRASGKTFVAHVVGTASAVAATVDVDVAVVCAALLHAAYEFGDFGDGRPGSHPAHRRELDRVVGESAERLVTRYQAGPWTPDEVDRLIARSRAGRLAGEERTVVVLRVANECDEHLDAGIRISGKFDQPMHTHDAVARVAELADAMGEERLASLMRTIVADELALDFADGLRRTSRRSTVVVPRSYRHPVDMVARRGRRFARRIEDGVSRRIRRR